MPSAFERLRPQTTYRASPLDPTGGFRCQDPSFVFCGVQKILKLYYDQ